MTNILQDLIEKALNEAKNKGKELKLKKSNEEVN